MLCCLLHFNLATIGVIVLTTLAVLYFYVTRNNNFFKSRGIDGPKPLPLFGNFLSMFRKPIPELDDERVRKYGKIHGTFLGWLPVLTVAEPELIKDVMVKDFNVFVNRNNITFDDPLFNRFLTAVKDDDWKNLRSIISPTFSSGKMRRMHYLIEECTKSMSNALIKAAKEGKEVELKDLMGKYTMDVIARCAFATKIDTYNDPNNLFIKYAIQIFKGNPFRGFAAFILPRFVVKLFNIHIIDPKIIEFFRTAVLTIMDKRSHENSKHNDFLQLMIEAKRKSETNKDSKVGDSSDEEIETLEAHNKSKYPFTDDDIIANSLIFFLAGYETTASLLAYLFHSLAIYSECQIKLLNEIMDHLNEDGSIDYETTARLPYLDACVSETLRLYNPAVSSTRICSQEYTLGDTGVTLPKGTMIQIPIHAIHHNPDFYPNPYTFDPERFTSENKDKLIPYTYLPFGLGPRNCVGMRFALMEAKALIVNILPKIEFVRTERTKVPLQFRKMSGFLQTNDITVGVKLRVNV